MRKLNKERDRRQLGSVIEALVRASDKCFSREVFLDEAARLLEKHFCLNKVSWAIFRNKASQTDKRSRRSNSEVRLLDDTTDFSPKIESSNTSSSSETKLSSVEGSFYTGSLTIPILEMEIWQKAMHEARLVFVGEKDTVKRALRVARQESIGSIISSLFSIYSYRESSANLAMSFAHEVKHVVDLQTSFIEEFCTAHKAQEHEVSKLMRPLAKLSKAANSYTCLQKAFLPNAFACTERISLETIVAESIEDTLCIQPNTSNLSITVLPSPHVELRANRLAWKVLISNLLMNAIKYSMPTPMVKISWTSKNEQVQLVVEDNGIGIPRGEEEMIFAHGYRASNAREFPGSGTGLFLSKAIADQIGAHITASSNSINGCTIVVCFKQVVSFNRPIATQPMRQD